MIYETYLFTLTLMAVLLTTNCTYRHKYFSQTNSPLNPENNDYVLQFDDYGKCWNKQTADEALKQIENLVQTNNTIVIVFIHGWHHNAKISDKNLLDFQKTLIETRKRLINDPDSSTVYKESRRYLTGSDGLKIVGIYIGWRGRSLPGPLDFGTFWGRKAAAERVGNGDFREFLIRLNTIYKVQREKRQSSKTTLFMGLTTFGHSFGGQVLFRAVAPEIEHNLIYKTQHQMPDQQTNKDLVEDLQGFGDLVVLINPALEAFQYQRIYELGSQIKFGKHQLPLILTISSAGDSARQKYFPLGRRLGSLFSPNFRKNQKSLWTKALGEYKEHRTHQISFVKKNCPLFEEFDPSLYFGDRDKLIDLDISNMPMMAGVSITPDGYDFKAYFPFIVAYSDVNLVPDHSKIFDQPLGHFLNDFVAIIQGKRMLIEAPQPKIENNTFQPPD